MSRNVKVLLFGLALVSGVLGLGNRTAKASGCKYNQACTVTVNGKQVSGYCAYQCACWYQNNGYSDPACSQ